ncbi:MAG: NAD(+)/NADH kinase [Burkholderiales bacterium]|nr:NAD(+)/NADH kinase [Burkholderiales bacterium]
MQFKKISIVGKQGSEHVSSFVLSLANYLVSAQKQIYIDCHEDCKIYSTENYTCGKLVEWLNELDLIIVIGGDGTLLSVARMVVDSNIPVIGINQGRLGFMTDIASHEMIDFVNNVVVQEHYTVEDRSLIYAEVLRSDNNIYSSVALNDVVISRGAIGNMIEFDISIDSQFVLSQKSDGIIFSTPTGSTAYSLAAGGPILHPNAHVFSIIPICPQSLTNRPLVISDCSTVEFTLARENSTQIHFDGQECFDLEINDKVILKKYPKIFKLVHPVGYNYYRTLRRKLDWSKRVS